MAIRGHTPIPQCSQIHSGELGSLTAVEIDASAQSGTGLLDAGGVVVIGRSRIFGQKLATDALVIAFGFVVSDVFTNKMSQILVLTT